MTMQLQEEQAAELMETVRFLYPDEEYPHDETTVRAMIVQGGTPAQIREAIAIAAINMRVGREDKTRYAAGVLRNLMNPSRVYGFDGEDEPEPKEPEQPRRRWFRREEPDF